MLMTAACSPIHHCSAIQWQFLYRHLIFPRREKFPINFDTRAVGTHSEQARSPEQELVAMPKLALRYCCIQCHKKPILLKELHLFPALPTLVCVQSYKRKICHRGNLCSGSFPYSGPAILFNPIGSRLRIPHTAMPTMACHWYRSRHECNDVSALPPVTRMMYCTNTQA